MPMKASAEKQSITDEVQSALEWLNNHSNKATLDGMARHAISSDKAYGVTTRGGYAKTRFAS